MEENKNIQNEQAQETPATEAAEKTGFFANKKNVYIVAAIAAVAIVAGIVLAVVLGGGKDTPVDNDDETAGDVDNDNGGEVGGEVDEKLIAPDVDKETLGYVFFEKFAEIKKADATKSAEAIVNEILESKLGTAIQFPMVMPADPEFLSGFKAEAEISGYKSAAILTSGMMGVAFISYVFDLEEGTDVKEFVKNVEKNVDPSWNMCTTAETVTVGAYDNSVFLIMCPAKIPSSISGKADILEPTVTEGSASEAIWNEFKALMSGENAPAFAIDVATALSEGVFAGEVTEADWCIEDENLFAYTVDGYSGASYITSGDKAVYVFQLEEGMEIENWTGYYFDGIKADQYAFGAYNSMIILMINAD